MSSSNMAGFRHLLMSQIRMESSYSYTNSVCLLKKPEGRCGIQSFTFSRVEICLLIRIFSINMCSNGLFVWLSSIWMNYLHRETKTTLSIMWTKSSWKGIPQNKMAQSVQENFSDSEYSSKNDENINNDSIKPMFFPFDEHWILA